MKTPNLTIAGYCVGFLFATLWSVRYFFEYPDKNIALIGVLIGAGICYAAWVYQMKYEIGEIRTSLDAFETNVQNIFEKQKEEK